MITTKTEFLFVCPKETQIELAMREDTSTQIDEPCIFSQGTQIDHPTVGNFFQEDVEHDILFDYII